ncbi:MAG: type II toxin-antitoxin system VapC family toxin [Calditrichaeota bacterium]|nr:type II toxin-antitoxin system VapC family toxin [Calditrichota bacterium]
MKGVLVDSNVLLDVFVDDPNWADWSENQLSQYGDNYPLYINPIIYTEISIGFARIEELENAISGCGLFMLPLPREALFLAGKVFLQYRRRKGAKASPLPDFFIGAHAAVAQLKLLTRDISRYRTCFPTVQLICPK